MEDWTCIEEAAMPMADMAATNSVLLVDCTVSSWLIRRTRRLSRSRSLRCRCSDSRCRCSDSRCRRSKLSACTAAAISGATLSAKFTTLLDAAVSAVSLSSCSIARAAASSKTLPLTLSLSKDCEAACEFEKARAERSNGSLPLLHRLDGRSKLLRMPKPPDDVEPDRSMPATSRSSGQIMERAPPEMG